MTFALARVRLALSAVLNPLKLILSECKESSGGILLKFITLAFLFFHVVAPPTPKFLQTSYQLRN